MTDEEAAAAYDALPASERMRIEEDVQAVIEAWEQMTPEQRAQLQRDADRHELERINKRRRQRRAMA
jgi:hypothetical protein